MNEAYVIRNQHGQYLSRREDWISGRDAAAVFWKPHYDEALNQLIEVNAKDIYLRGKVVKLELSELKRPMINELGPEPEPDTEAEPIGHTQPMETA